MIDVHNTKTTLFFFGHYQKKEEIMDKSCLSQWFPSTFQEDGIHFQTAEHYMMYQKARLFGAEETARRILKAQTAKEVKRLGRHAIKDFNEDVWVANREQIVVQGNRLKFTQNEDLKTFLLSTKQKHLVEASPYDKIWGIGLRETDPRATYTRSWQGLNLLGNCLMIVRKELEADT